MRIILTCGSLSWGGIEMTLFNDAVELSKNNTVYIVCRRNSTIMTKAAKAGLNVYPYLYNNFNLLYSILKLFFLFLKLKPRIIHSRLSHDLWAIVPAMKLSGTRARLFLTKHMASGVNKKDLFHRYIYRNIHKIFAVSKFIQNNIMLTCPVNEKQVVILSDAINIKKFTIGNYDVPALKKQFGLKENTLYIGMGGRFTPGKGHEEFLKAAEIIVSRTEQPVEFLIMGGMSYNEKKFEKNIKAKVRSMKISVLIHFTGFHENMAEILSVIDILAFPSHEESFGIILIEAMALEKPVAASNSGAIPEIINDNENGLLVKPKDVKSLADVLLQLINSPSLRQKLSKNAREHIINNYDFEKQIKTIEEYYEEAK